MNDEVKNKCVEEISKNTNGEFQEHIVKIWT